MARPDTTTLAALRENLPPFCEAVEPSSELIDFCQYYGIDFAARSPAVEHRIGSVRSGQYFLAVHRYQQPGATSNLLLVHGYLDHCGLFGKLIEYGLNSGCNVVVFDLPGHGLSSGEPAAIDDFKEYSGAISSVLAAVDLPGLPWWTMAQSTGCAALIDYAGKYPWNFAGAVFLAPLIRPASWGKVRLGYALLHRFRDSIARQFSENSGDEQFLAFTREDPLQSRTLSLRWIGALSRWLSALEYRDLGAGPLLVIQGDADGTVDWRYNMKHIAELFPGCQIEYLSGAGHHLANETTDFRRLYLGKIGAFLAALPNQSGGE
ncbi:MAG: alpha-beta hydrolase superfamily lysophospholipase [Halioglobus sp.]